MKRYASIVLAALWIGSGCSTRIATTPAAPNEKAAPAKPAQASPKPQPASAVPVAGSERARPADSAAPVAGTPATPTSKSPDGQPPPATDSAYVFSPKQAVSASAAPSGLPSKSATGAPTTPRPDSTTVPSQGELQLVVVTSAPEVSAGGITTVDVLASSSASVVDAPLHLTFDPNVVEFVDGVPGDFLTQGGSSVVFLADGASRPGDVAVAAGRVDRQHGASGSGLLCRVRFRGLRTGTTSVLVGRAKAWGSHGEALTVVSAGATIVVR